MSKQLDRKMLMVNQRRGITQHFEFNANLGYKSKATPSVVTWAGRGRGVEGESSNKQGGSGFKPIIGNRKPL